MTEYKCLLLKYVNGSWTMQNAYITHEYSIPEDGGQSITSPASEVKY